MGISKRPEERSSLEAGKGYLAVLDTRFFGEELGIDLSLAYSGLLFSQRAGY